MSTSDYLPSITMANDFKVSSHGVVLFISFLHYLLITFFMSLDLPLTYYLLVISLVPLIVSFLLPKVLFVYKTGVQDG